ncbi:efflux transporter outer membrane subunit [Chromobacterium vaccinii]|uniref:efflux transporter outer membrane subunit n=1 Tax=Chromobacterium vaccinii TaxID=1108595 RepID=UPI000E11BCDC|nr:efflux transporter outer membrane subunit [Chromobacterium vaccinii]SUX53684.1 Outer membrane protein oprM precursor [Chromobacterium vaccinii]
MDKRKKWTWLALAALVAGCQATPYQRQPLRTPAQWAQPNTAEQDMGREAWWGGFADPALLRVLSQARSRNPDLEIALLKLRKAQLEAGLADSEARPTPSGSLSGSRSRPLDGGDWSNSRSAGLKVDYEVDLWGRLDAAQRSAGEAFAASRYDQISADLLSDSAAAGLYWDIAAQKAKLALAEAALADAVRMQALAQSRRKAGALAEQDATQADSEALAQRASLLSQREELRKKENALALLLDGPPGSSLPEIPPLAAQPPLPGIAAGLPGDLLRRRPDLQAAEARLRGKLADADQRRADFFPRFSLNGDLSRGSAVPGAQLGLGATLSLPFLDWRRLDLKLKSSEADYQLAEVEFRKTLYGAYREVEEGLDGRRRLAASAALQSEALRLAGRNAQLAQSRYLAGETDIQSWLEAARGESQAREKLLDLNLERLKNLAYLYKALGGGASPA